MIVKLIDIVYEMKKIFLLRNKIYIYKPTNLKAVKPFLNLGKVMLYPLVEGIWIMREIYP